jgi:hypothetical protein
MRSMVNNLMTFQRLRGSKVANFAILLERSVLLSVLTLALALALASPTSLADCVAWR